MERQKDRKMPRPACWRMRRGKSNNLIDPRSAYAARPHELNDEHLRVGVSTSEGACELRSRRNTQNLIKFAPSACPSSCTAQRNPSEVSPALCPRHCHVTNMPKLGCWKCLQRTRCLPVSIESSIIEADWWSQFRLRGVVFCTICSPGVAGLRWSHGLSSILIP